VQEEEAARGLGGSSRFLVFSVCACSSCKCVAEEGGEVKKVIKKV
jgi:hypothetical protein